MEGGNGILKWSAPNKMDNYLDIQQSIPYTVFRLIQKHGEPKLRLRGKQPFSTREPDPDHTGGGMQKSNPPPGGFFRCRFCSMKGQDREQEVKR